MEKELEKKIRDYIAKTGDKGFIEILDILEDEAYEIANHVLTNWGDKGLAKFWTTIGKRLNNINAKIGEAFEYEHLK